MRRLIAIVALVSLCGCARARAAQGTISLGVAVTVLGLTAGDDCGRGCVEEDDLRVPLVVTGLGLFVIGVGALIWMNRGAAPPEEEGREPQRMSDESVQAGIGAVLDRVMGCRRDQAKKGTVVVRVLVDKEGNVRGTEVIEAFDPVIGVCAAERARGARFPEMGSGRNFLYRFRFD